MSNSVKSYRISFAERGTVVDIIPKGPVWNDLAARRWIDKNPPETWTTLRGD